MERAKKLVKATPPRGEEYLRMLQTVLHREIAWTRWKDVSGSVAVSAPSPPHSPEISLACNAGGYHAGSGEIWLRAPTCRLDGV